MQVRVIMRDLSGKFSWDASILYAPPVDLVESLLSSQTTPSHTNNMPHSTTTPPFNTSNVSLNTSSTSNTTTNALGLGLTGLQPSTNTMTMSDMMTSSLIVTSPPRHTLRHRPPGILPSFEDSADDLDNLDDVSGFNFYLSLF